MKIHAIRTGEVTIKQHQREGAGHGAARRLAMMTDKQWTERLPIYAWVVEHPEGLIVIDTGETSRTSEPGYFPRWHPYFHSGVKEWVKPDDEIGPQLTALGMSPDDVRWVVMTHLHTDHAGGLGAFGRSEILVSATELQQASGFAGKARGYLPQHWPRDFKPTRVEFRPEPYGAFAESLALTRAGDVRLVPTSGHTKGHLSVIVEEAGQAIFIAGDTSYTQELMLLEVVDGISPNEDVARRTLRAIRDFATSRPTVYLPSHDPRSAERLEARQTVAVRSERVGERRLAA